VGTESPWDFAKKERKKQGGGVKEDPAASRNPGSPPTTSERRLRRRWEISFVGGGLEAQSRRPPVFSEAELLSKLRAQASAAQNLKKAANFIEPIPRSASSSKEKVGSGGGSALAVRYVRAVPLLGSRTPPPVLSRVYSLIRPGFISGTALLQNSSTELAPRSTSSNSCLLVHYPRKNFHNWLSIWI